MEDALSVFKDVQKVDLLGIDTISVDVDFRLQFFDFWFEDFDLMIKLVILGANLSLLFELEIVCDLDCSADWLVVVVVFEVEIQTGQLIQL